jgi:Pentapeptide repeats (8 copies)/NACHT domain
MATKIWKFLTTDISELNWGQVAEVTKTGAEAGKAVLELAKVLKEQQPKVQTLKPYVEQISSLLDVLNLPFSQIVGATIPFAPLGLTLLKLVSDATRPELTLEQAVALVSQAAFLESFQTIVALPTTQELLVHGQMAASPAIAAQIKQLGELELDAAGANRTIASFPESPLAPAYQAVAAARLQEVGLTAAVAQQLSDRMAWHTHRHLHQELAKAGEQVKPLAELFRNGGQAVLEKYQSLDTYLAEQIQPQPLARVFTETFTFQDIYVPLQARRVSSAGLPEQDNTPQALQQWAIDWLNDRNKLDQVLFIQGEPGRGKSVFCRLFADWVRQHEYPRWVPVLIRLRDVRTLEKDFEETLRKAVDRDFTRNDPGWLTDRHRRFLFLLDGWDELLLEGRTSGGLAHFLWQVGQFQKSCQSNSEKGHRVLLTGRSFGWQEIEHLMPKNLEWLEILALDDQLQDRWLHQWGQLIDANPRDLTGILRNPRLPAAVRELAREPLLLYLLAAMHRDGELHLARFAQAEGARAKVLIYQKTLNWVLTQQRPEPLNRELTELETTKLRRVLAEAGLCVVQSGGEWAALAMIARRLQHDDRAKTLWAEAARRLQEHPLRNALVAFYVQPRRGQTGAIEFTHKSFGEFLAAERLVESLAAWAKLSERHNLTYRVDDAEMHREIYDLFGYGGLTPEILADVMALLVDGEATEHLVTLFCRLQDFYGRWCHGEFIDAPVENLPQWKQRSLRADLPDRQFPLGQRQVDVCVGLNVMALLLELHHYAQTQPAGCAAMVFYPCGQPDTANFAPDGLQKIIAYSACVDPLVFSRTLGRLLYGLDLRGVNLSGVTLAAANLSQTNLNAANLSGAHLAGVNLNQAQLNNADLFGAYLSKASLVSADLRGADLSRVTLTAANLSHAVLCGANLCRSNLSQADLSYAKLEGAAPNAKAPRPTRLEGALLFKTNLAHITWDASTQWVGVMRWADANNVPESLKPLKKLP